MFRQGKALVPSFSAFAVTNLLRDHFGDYVDVGFTAEMEEDLDQISNGERDGLSFIKAFYRDGEGGHPGLEPMVARAEPNIEYPVIEIGQDAATGESLRVRVGRYGPFVQRGEGGTGNTATLPKTLPPADLTVEKALALLKAKADGPKDLGADPLTGRKVYVQHGRFGHYVQLGETPPKVKGKAPEMPKRASIPAAISASAITLDQALKLLSLPRDLGAHPADGEIIVASNGRFGPYVKHGDEFRSLEDGDDVHTITVERALELLTAPKKSRRRTATRTVLRTLGAHPQSGADVKLMEGRYGPYVTDGEVNASLPKIADPATFTLEAAVELLKARAEAGPSKRPRGGGRFGGARKSGGRKRAAT
jgi:DNA topoisomerase-1